MKICKECGRSFHAITHKHLKRHGISVQEYLNTYELKQSDLTSKETRQRLSKKLRGTKVGNNNPSKRKDVKNKISRSLKKRWSDGTYDKRVNGMTDRIKELHHGYKPELHTVTYFAEKEYNKFLSNFQSIKACSRCGKKKVINVHHVDEDHSNFLPSNLEPLCVPCHTSFHYEKQKLPFVSITKIFTFASAHYLPNYNGKCSNLHGHEWKLEVTIKRRMDTKTYMVMDFSYLKKIVNKHIIDSLDHILINDLISIPTAENIMVRIWEVLMFDALLKGIYSIRIWESKDSYSKIGVEDMIRIYKENIEIYLKDYSK